MFEPLTLRRTTFKNRIWVSPMCQYSAGTDGVPHDWHLINLGQFAVGGAGLVLTEATAISATARISPFDTGLWNDEQVAAWRRIVEFLAARGARTGVQLSHAGRKGSTSPMWEGANHVPAEQGGWPTASASDVAFGPLPAPAALDLDGIAGIVADFRAAALRATQVGFDVIELHAAHGYLLNQFISPLSNRREDAYGGDFAGRTRLLLEVAEAVREVWAGPLFVRISATDWAPVGGWEIEDTVRVSALLAERGVDLMDVSTGGIVYRPTIPVGPGYQVRFAELVRREAGIPTGAVGLITEPRQAQDIVSSGQADAVFLGRALLRNPHWPLAAAAELGVDVAWPPQYERAKLPH